MELTSLNRLRGALKAKVTQLEQFETPSCLELRLQLNDVSSLRNKTELLRKDYYSLPSDVDLTEADRKLELLEDRLYKTEIQDITKSYRWQHIRSEQNPSDFVSRGLSAENLVNCELWWKGPETFCYSLHHSEVTEDPKRDDFFFTKELKKDSERTLKLSLNSIILDNWLNLTNNNLKLIHIFSFVLRFAWNATTPHAHTVPPNFGGLWKSCIKSVKYLLRRVVGNARLTYEEISTVLAQIEVVLISRPISPLSSDPNDYQALTPGHFLIGSPLTTIPEPDLLNLKINRLSRWQLTTKIVQGIWQRWKRDYLSNLQQRTKWYWEKGNVAIDDMVLIVEDNIPPCT
ncbi:uncharacterized protein TNCV_3808641 [Trichonephila clavipes]|nr:uncharacterized protein TNCV_3808641 [Trichonephila clavipes]